MLFNELKDGLTANKMRSWPAELISIILLYCFFPWKTHLSFLSTCCFLFTIENGEVCAKVSAKEETLKKLITALISTWQFLFHIESISEDRREFIQSVQSTPRMWNSPELSIGNR